MSTEKTYQIVNGTSYDNRTPKIVIDWLETSRERRQRIRLFLGDTKNGRDWKELHDIIGVVSRSTGSIKIPLLIKTSRAYGGGAILDYCIVRITVDKKTVYIHPDYYLYKKSVGIVQKGNFYQVRFDDEESANFNSMEKAENYIKFLKGNRNKI